HDGVDPFERDREARARPAEQSEPRPVASEEDARLGRAVLLEAVEAARVPEERPGDGRAHREGADQYDDAGGSDLQPPLQRDPPVRRAQSPIRRSVNVAGPIRLRP